MKKEKNELSSDNFKNKLQEFCQKNKLLLPKYLLIEKKNQDNLQYFRVNKYLIFNILK